VKGIDRHGDDLLVATCFILHQQSANRAAADDGPRNNRNLAHDQYVNWIAILGLFCVGHGKGRRKAY
jgi:hypothetical protein